MCISPLVSEWRLVCPYQPLHTSVKCCVWISSASIVLVHAKRPVEQIGFTSHFYYHGVGCPKACSRGTYYSLPDATKLGLPTKCSIDMVLGDFGKNMPAGQTCRNVRPHMVPCRPDSCAFLGTRVLCIQQGIWCYLAGECTRCCEAVQEWSHEKVLWMGPRNTAVHLFLAAEDSSWTMDRSGDNGVR